MPRRAGIHQRPPGLAALPLLTRCLPSPCGRLSRPRTTTQAPPRPTPTADDVPARPPSSCRRGGRCRTVPTFTIEPLDGGGAQLSPCGIATSTPQTFLVASPADDMKTTRKLPATISGHAPRPSPDPSGSSWWAHLRGFKRWFLTYTFPSSLAGPRPSDGAGPSRRCRGCCPPSPPSRGSGCPQLQPACCDRPMVVPFHHHTVQWRLVALEVAHP